MNISESSYVLGIDQGTTQTTAVVLDSYGRMIDRRSVRLPVRFPRPGWVEQDPWDIVRTVQEVTSPLVEQYPIMAMGFDNQGETFVLWDSVTGEPLSPAVVWQDKRGEPICDSLRTDVDAHWLQRKTGLRLDSYFLAPKLSYLLNDDPSLRAAAANGTLRLGTTETWTLWHLSGGALHVTDPSTASRTLLYDINRLAWDDDLLRLFDVPRGILPAVCPSAGLVGEVQFGTGKAVPLYAMLADQQAALFGQACFGAGDMKCTFGTGSFLLMNTGDQPCFSDRGLLTTLAWHWDDQIAYALDGGVFVTGAAVQWLTEHLGLLPDPGSSAGAAAQSKDAGVRVIPALAGLAAPHWRTDVRGAVFGLSRSTSREDIVRATLDGIAFRVSEVVHALIEDSTVQPGVLRVDGGPSGNPYLMQYLSNLLDMEVHVAAEREATAIGIANLAAHAAFGIPLDELASRWKAETIYRPGMDAAVRRRLIAAWQHALESLIHYHDLENLSDDRCL